MKNSSSCTVNKGKGDWYPTLYFVFYFCALDTFDTEESVSGESETIEKEKVQAWGNFLHHCRCSKAIQQA